MPGRSTVAYGNEVFDTLVFSPNTTFPTLVANASSTNTLTLPNTGTSLQSVLPGDCIQGFMQAPPAHLFLDNCYCATPGVITITWSTDGTGVTGASNLQVIFNIVRFENLNVTGLAGMPQSLA